MDISIILFILALITAAVVIYLFPLLNQRLSAERLDVLRYWISIAVTAAEQLFKDKQKAGDDKLRYVEDFIKSKGLKVNSQELRALVEHTVYRLKEVIK